ncbi:MAG TPA: tetratricopeptide repeat protein [Vicinamibacteria bacterium]|nr:tetratricopeptide repeat protein [Vicinamibacteria bacterium]
MIWLVLTLLQPSIPEKMREALALMESGDADGARELLESILEESPEHGPAHLQLGQLALALEDWQDAKEHLEVAVRSNPQRLFLAWHLLGTARRATGDLPGAKQAFEAALEHAPDFLPPRLALAELAEAQGDLWTALAHYRSAVGSEAAYGALANLARRMGALELARCAVSRAGDGGAAAYLSAVIEQEAGAVDRAIALAERALSLGYENAAVYVTLGNLFHEKMRLSESVVAFEKAVAIDPAAAESLASFALTSLTTEDYTRLRGLLERHVAAHPDSLNTLYGLGAMYLRENELSSARDLFERLAGLVPNASQVHYNLAMVYARLDEKALAKDALTRFRELKELEDEEWERQNAIHRLRLSRDESSEADERARLALQVVESGGSEPDDLVALGEALVELGRRDEAMPYLERALAQSPYDRRVLEALGRNDRLALLEPDCEPSMAAPAEAAPAVLPIMLDTFRGDWIGEHTPQALSPRAWRSGQWTLRSGRRAPEPRRNAAGAWLRSGRIRRELRARSAIQASLKASTDMTTRRPPTRFSSIAPRCTCP